MDLSSLLHRAENLTNETKLNYELPHIERTLQQVLQATDELHSRVTRTGGKDKDIQAHILLGSKGVDLPKLNQKLNRLNARKTFEPIEVASADTDVATFLKNERENAIARIIEDTNKNISDTVNKQKWANLTSTWNEEKARLLDALIGPSQNFIDLQKLPDIDINRAQYVLRSQLDENEQLYAQELRQYNELLLNGEPRPNLVQQFAQLALSFNNTRISDMWDMLASVTHIDEPNRTDPIKNRQQRQDFVQQAKSYLEQRYSIYLKSLVPPTHSTSSYQLVCSYVSCRFNAQQSIGLVDMANGYPLWPLVYYSLRCGAYSTAVAFLREASINCEDFAQLIEDRTAGVVNSKTESQLKLQYANKIRNSTDAYKKAVYCIYLVCDQNEMHGEVAKTIDDFLWIKLAMLQPSDASGYSNLQSLILEKYGEKHFNANQQPHLYFQTLALTGQFEVAIEFLSRIDEFRSHAVHMAIALHELRLLGGARSVEQPLVSVDISDPPPLRRLNLARLVRQYVQEFERSNIPEALQYYYTLRSLRDPNGCNIFLICVCDLIVGNGGLDLQILNTIFGQHELLTAGESADGLFQQFDCEEFDTRTLAALVADKLEQRGNFETAIRLYEVAGQHNAALKHINVLLAQVVHEPPSKSTKRSRLYQEAKRLKECLSKKPSEVEPRVYASFLLLQSLIEFFDNYHKGNATSSLEVLQQTKLVPTLMRDVDDCLVNVKRLSGEIVKVLPDVIVAAMDITCTQYRELKNSGKNFREGLACQQIHVLRERAKVIAHFAANVPYRMPAATNSRLIQLELLMS